ncbi:neuronal acetylcholine receptor subunit alpha-10-like [Antedon mediterranea]|uniref:neuronal acetylcholine receptor subunit alpha-10-like n=1 Tax=Antedon mediterranea TaxID=105859 RepID=UPI003AF665CA
MSFLTMIIKIFIIIAYLSVGSALRSNESMLTEQLLLSYGPRTTRPVDFKNSTVNVTLRFIVTQVINLDEKAQALTVNGWFKMIWTDQRLIWDENDQNIKDIFVEKTDIWLPDITLYNNIDGQFERQKEDVFLRVTSDGTVTWASPSIYTSSCRMNVRKFPFDSQLCTLEFGSWTYDGYELNLMTVTGRDAEQTEFTENGVWVLTSVNVARQVRYFNCCPEPYPILTYSLKLTRRYEFYLANILLPCILLSFLSMLVFYLPPESGEKISFGMTTILGLLLFQQMIAETLPPSADNAPIIGTYFTFIISMGCASVLVTSVILNIYCGSSERPIPDWIRILVLGKLGAIIGRQNADAKKKKAYNLVEKKPQDVATDLYENNIRSDTNDFCGDIGKSEVNISRPRGSARRKSYDETHSNAGGSKQNDGFEGQWREVAVILDRLFLIISLIIVSIAAVHVLISIV